MPVRGRPDRQLLQTALLRSLRQAVYAPENIGHFGLAYEAYTEMAEQMLARIGDEIKQQWPKVEVVSIVHRTGRLEIGEPSVVIAVSTPHRGDGCFEACRYAIERLKAIVPIWKQENWTDGAVWIEGPQQPELTAGPGAGLAQE